MDVFMQKLLRGSEEADSSEFMEAREHAQDVAAKQMLLHERFEDEDEEEEEDSGEDLDTLRQSHDSSSSGEQFLHEEDTSEQSHFSESLQETQQSRYYGHPLGVEELDMQEFQVQQYKQQLQEEFMNEFRHHGQWNLPESRVRAKVLVAEGFYKEKEHLMQQHSHIMERDLLGAEPRPLRRFRATHRFRDAGFHANRQEVLEIPELHKKVVTDRMRTLQSRWGRIMHHVEHDMCEVDNFPNVIKNLSTMRIFLEGQQSMSYCVDPMERQRRIYLSQAVIQTIHARNDGLFLRDVHPRGEPLNL